MHVRGALQLEWVSKWSEMFCCTDLLKQFFTAFNISARTQKTCESAKWSGFHIVQSHVHTEKFRKLSDFHATTLILTLKSQSLCKTASCAWTDTETMVASECFCHTSTRAALQHAVWPQQLQWEKAGHSRGMWHHKERCSAHSWFEILTFCHHEMHLQATVQISGAPKHVQNKRWQRSTLRQHQNQKMQSFHFEGFFSAMNSPNTHCFSSCQCTRMT